MDGCVRVGMYYHEETNEKGLTLKEVRDLRRFNRRGEPLG